MMAHDEKTKAYVRRYYVFDCLTLEQAAEKAKVSYNTARRWKKEAEARGDNWDTVRDANTMASGKVEDVARGMLTTFVIYFEKTMEELRHAEELPVSDKAKLIQGLGDSYSKMVASSKRLLPEVSEMATAVKTMMMFGDYVQTKTTDKQVLDVIIDALNEFGAILKKEYKE
jgi:conserved possible DNA-binding protein